MTIAIVTGSRNLHVGHEWWPLLDRAREKHSITALWHGAARGVDEGVAVWAAARGLEVEAFPAPWELFKAAKVPAKIAGPRRNADMADGKRGYALAEVTQLDQAPLALPERAGESPPGRRTLITTEQVDGTPELLIALPGWKGTRGMIREAEARGLYIERLNVEPWVINRWHYKDAKTGLFRLPPGSIDIQRGTALGNPFVVGEPLGVAVSLLGTHAVAAVCGHANPDQPITGEQCLALYRAWLWRQLARKDRGVESMLRKIGAPEVIAAGGGHPHLVCTCKRPDGSGFCHGDVVLRAWRYVHGRRQPDAPRVDAGQGSTPGASGQSEHDTAA